MIAIIPDVHVRTPFAERALGNDASSLWLRNTDINQPEILLLPLSVA
jgi:hypothetical protein